MPRRSERGAVSLGRRGAASSCPAAGGNGLRGFSLLRCFSPPAPVPPENHDAEDVPLFHWRTVPASFFFLNKMNLQATCRLCQHKAAFRRVIQPPPASLGLCSSLHYPIFFFFLILHKKNASQLLTHLPWTVSARQARHPPQMAARAPALPQARFLKGSTAADA